MAVVCNETPLKFDRRIFIVRDPRDELLSRLLYFVRPWIDAHGLDANRNSAWVEALCQKQKNPESFSFLKMVTIFDQLYDTKMYDQVLHERSFEHYLNFVSSKEANGFVLRYEDFMKGELESLEKYLGQHLTDKRDVGALSRTKRSASSNNWKSFFTQEDVEVLRPVYKDLLDKMGYTDWTSSSAGNWNLKITQITYCGSSAIADRPAELILLILQGIGEQRREFTTLMLFLGLLKSSDFGEQSLRSCFTCQFAISLQSLGARGVYQ